MPNVSLPAEMVNLMTASRAYEANLKVLQTLRQQLEQTLTIIEASGGLTPIAATGLPLAEPLSGGDVAGGNGMFARLVDRALESIPQSHQNAQTAIHDLATGQTDQLHGVLLQVAQADLSFRLLLEIRNRLTDA